MPLAECHYAECHYAECHNAECHNAECQYAECRSAPLKMGDVKRKALKKYQVSKETNYLAPRHFVNSPLCQPAKISNAPLDQNQSVQGNGKFRGFC